MKSTSGVDIVLTWVDDSDTEWTRLRDAYMPEGSRSQSQEGTTPLRFRDWGLLKYWFRGIENNLPWIRNVFLVTENPTPPWMNTAHPRLRIVRHHDFIPADYLPTFNSRAIELNLHRIEGLSERFVYFNDDMFVLSPISEEHFFLAGLPRAFGIMNALSVDDSISHAMLNNVGVINKYFAKGAVIRRSFSKWFTPKYGIKNLQNLALLPWKRFTGFHNAHLPLALTRSDAEALWTREFEKLDKTSRSKFRGLDNLNPYLISWWAICNGKFAPATLRDYGRYVQITEKSFDHVLPIVSRGRDSVLCINDGDVPDFEDAKRRLIAAFESRLPEKSSYEV